MSIRDSPIISLPVEFFDHLQQFCYRNCAHDDQYDGRGAPWRNARGKDFRRFRFVWLNRQMCLIDRLQDCTGSFISADADCNRVALLSARSGRK